MSEKLPKGWKKVKLGEVALYINRGITPKYVEKNGITVINQKCIRNGNIDFKLVRLHDINKKFQSEKILQTNDILINSTGVGTAGRVAIYKTSMKATVDSHVSILRIDTKKAFPKFVFYNLRKREKELEEIAEGSTGQIELKRENIKEVDIPLPSLPEQKAIASVLSSFDDKIDLLHRQNQTLEQMAQTLFRKWFIKDADDSWEITTIGKELHTVLGGTPSTSKPEYWDGDIPWINSGEVNRFRIDSPTKFITKLGLEKSNTKLLPKGTTVIAITGATLGQTSLLEIDSCANQSVVGIIPNERLCKEFVYLWAKFKIREIILNETGGAQPHINKNDINETELIIPPKIYLKSKIPYLRKLFNKISNNIRQIRTLENLRDTLLPKLMSGEVRVKL
ncbi:restriction endonuclease subunit S [Nitratiruptor sp. YY09-18]|uniref:restriction endonuclease subunit S n=1 Tax=Nitratiruptor sp. YY09-18 TaxID=2724901 RepID=UPI0019151858|nr:restriction endonuclease subunit S [Nitratiruptor sp. YY09-18]BCD68813.1 type I restriction enzyme, S subunit [Nitratiruptor sp. YY09-18]